MIFYKKYKQNQNELSGQENESPSPKQMDSYEVISEQFRRENTSQQTELEDSKNVMTNMEMAVKVLFRIQKIIKKSIKVIVFKDIKTQL